MVNQQAEIGAHRDKPFGGFDYIKITVLGFALAALWSSLNGVILPIRILEFVDESLKNTYLGLLTFTGLVLAMAIQPVVGTISDRSVFSWGRRRPYILLGIILIIVFLPAVGLASSYVLLLASYCLLQIGGNTAQAAYQPLIPEMVPEEKRGKASGVKGILEMLGALAVLRLIAYLMEPYFLGQGSLWLWLALGTLGTVLMVAMFATVLTVNERPAAGTSKSLVVSAKHQKLAIDVRLNRDFKLFLISRGLMGMPGVMLQLFALYYLMDVIGIADPVVVFADLLIVVGVCLLATTYPAGRLSDSIGRKPVIVFSGLMGALGIVALFFSQNYLHLMFSGGLLGIANGALLSSSWALATDLAVKGEEARYLGFTNLAMAGGSAMARLVGPLIDFFNNINTGLGYQVMLLVCLVSFLVGALLIIKVNRRQPHHLRND